MVKPRLVMAVEHQWIHVKNLPEAGHFLHLGLIDLLISAFLNAHVLHYWHENPTLLVFKLIVMAGQLQHSRQMLPLQGRSHPAERRQLEQITEWAERTGPVVGFSGSFLTLLIQGHKIRLTVAVICQEIALADDVILLPDVVLEVLVVI